MNPSQAYLSGLVEPDQISLVDFKRLMCPANVDRQALLLWWMTANGWEPTPEEASRYGFVSLRDVVRHLKDKGVVITSVRVEQSTPTSLPSLTERYRFMPTAESLMAAYGLLLRWGLRPACEGCVQTLAEGGVK